MQRTGAVTETRHDRRRNRTRDALTLATREIVATDGTSVSVQAIADRADVALTTLYNHFPSKEELLRAAAIRALADFEADVNASMAAISEPGEVVCVRTRRYLRMASTHPEIARFLVQLPPDILATPEFYSSQAEQDVLNAEAAGKLKTRNVSVAHLVVNASALSFTALRLSDRKISDADADELALELLILLGMTRATATRLVARTLPPARAGVA